MYYQIRFYTIIIKAKEFRYLAKLPKEKHKGIRGKYVKFTKINLNEL